MIIRENRRGSLSQRIVKDFARKIRQVKVEQAKPVFAQGQPRIKTWEQSTRLLVHFWLCKTIRECFQV